MRMRSLGPINTKISVGVLGMLTREENEPKF